MGRDRVFRTGLGVAVAIAWLVSVIADILIPEYQTPIAIHGLMGTVVGSIYADARIEAARNKFKRKDDDDSTS